MHHAAVKPLNKLKDTLHGDNLNSAVVSFVERLSSSQRLKMYFSIIWDLEKRPLYMFICREVYYAVHVPLSEGPLMEV